MNMLGHHDIGQALTFERTAYHSQGMKKPANASFFHEKRPTMIAGKREKMTVPFFIEMFYSFSRFVLHG